MQKWVLPTTSTPASSRVSVQEGTIEMTLKIQDPRAWVAKEQ